MTESLEPSEALVNEIEATLEGVAESERRRRYARVELEVSAVHRLLDTLIWPGVHDYYMDKLHRIYDEVPEGGDLFVEAVESWCSEVVADLRARLTAAGLERVNVEVRLHPWAPGYVYTLHAEGYSE